MGGAKKVRRVNSVNLQKEFHVGKPESVVAAALGGGGEEEVARLVEECNSDEHGKLRVRAKKHFANKKAWFDHAASLEDNFKRFLHHVGKDFEKGKNYLKTHKKRAILITIALICFVGLCGAEPLIAVGVIPAVVGTVLPTLFGLGFKECVKLAFDN